MINLYKKVTQTFDGPAVYCVAHGQGLNCSAEGHLPYQMWPTYPDRYLGTYVGTSYVLGD